MKKAQKISSFFMSTIPQKIFIVVVKASTKKRGRHERVSEQKRTILREYEQMSNLAKDDT